MVGFAFGFLLSAWCHQLFEKTVKLMAVTDLP
jgi:hypothetical protein